MWFPRCPLTPTLSPRGGERATGDAGKEGTLERDIVSHDVRKFFRLLLKKNGHVLEQFHSPGVVHATPEHAGLKRIAAGCVTRQHGLPVFEVRPDAGIIPGNRAKDLLAEEGA